MPYAILRFQKRKAGGVAGADRHNERKKTSYKSNPDIKTELSNNNYHFVKPNGKYKNLCDERIKAAGCKVRKDSVILVETILTASPEFINGLNKDEQYRFFERAFNFIADKVDKENIISAVVHMDETTPHMHLCFCPVTKDNRLSAKIIIGDRNKLEKWQDEYYEYMSAKYPALERGIPASISHRKHIPTYIFKQAGILENAREEILGGLKNISAFNAGKKRDEAIAVLEKYMPMMFNLTAQENRVNDYISALEKRNKELGSQIEEHSQEISNQQIELEAQKYQMRFLKHEIDRAKEFIQEVPEELVREIKRNKKSKSNQR